MIRKILFGLLFTALLPTVFSTDAQQPKKILRIGFLAFNLARSESNIDAFFQEMRRLGWIDGQNILFEFRNAQGNIDRLPGLAAELIGLKVDLIVTSSTPAAAIPRHCSWLPMPKAVTRPPL